MQKIVEKAKKYQKKLDSGKLIDVMLEIKTEVEGYTGKEIDLEDHIDQVTGAGNWGRFCITA